MDETAYLFWTCSGKTEMNWSFRRYVMRELEQQDLSLQQIFWQVHRKLVKNFGRGFQPDSFHFFGFDLLVKFFISCEG